MQLHLKPGLMLGWSFATQREQELWEVQEGRGPLEGDRRWTTAHVIFWCSIHNQTQVSRGVLVWTGRLKYFASKRAI